MTAYRIILADDHAMFRHCIKDLLSGVDRVKVIGEAGDYLKLFDLLRKESPEIVVCGISMPNYLGLSLTHEIKIAYPAVKILILTLHREKEYVENVLAAGADGCLLKENADPELFIAIEKMCRGECYVSPRLVGRKGLCF